MGVVLAGGRSAEGQKQLARNDKKKQKREREKRDREKRKAEDQWIEVEAFKYIPHCLRESCASTSFTNAPSHHFTPSSSTPYPTPLSHLSTSLSFSLSLSLSLSQTQSCVLELFLWFINMVWAGCCERLWCFSWSLDLDFCWRRLPRLKGSCLYLDWRLFFLLVGFVMLGVDRRRFCG